MARKKSTFKSYSWTDYLYIACFTAVVVLIFWKHPVDEDRFYALLNSEGVSDIKVTSQGTFFSGCDGRENKNSSFTGVKNKVPVSGVVCGSSFFKAYTIRYF